jgi:hypothetical protein
MSASPALRRTVSMKKRGAKNAKKAVGAIRPNLYRGHNDTRNFVKN